MASKVRHLLGISGGKDSAALSIYMNRTYPELDIEYYNSDTGCELQETIEFVDNLKSYLGKPITTLCATDGMLEKTPFDYFLKMYNGFLPSVKARWCTLKMKLDEFEKYVGDTPTVSYVAIRGDEDRDGYISTKPNIQAIFPFRRNIWSTDVIKEVLDNKNIVKFKECYEGRCEVIDKQTGDAFTLKAKLNVLLETDTVAFNHAVYLYLKKYTQLPVGMLDSFPLLENEDVIVKDDVYRILQESGVGIPAYYNLIDFEVGGKKGQYCRSRSGCYFCFFQQKIEWIWLYEQHPDLYAKAMEYEKDGYTWIQGESLKDLARPERIRQIKLEQIRKTEAEKTRRKSLVDILGEQGTNEFDSI